MPSKSVQLQNDPGTLQEEAGFGFCGRFWFESSIDVLTALASGGATGATQITSMFNRVSTVATAGDSCVLPPAYIGLSVAVLNDASNALQMFAQGTDTINGIAAATGVPQMGKSLVWYTCHTDGAWTANGIGTGYAGQNLTYSALDNITAHAGGGKASATPLTAAYNRVATVVTAGDSVILPVSAPGLVICVTNSGANPMQVYGAGTDTINGVATGTGVQQMQGSVVYYACTTAGSWVAQGLGSGFTGQYPTYSTQTGITASGTQTQAAGTPITASQVQISTCAVAGNAVTLMPAVAGMEITVINNGANSCNVFPASQTGGGVTGGDKINALAQNAAFSLVAGTPTIFYCFVTGTWITK